MATEQEELRLTVNLADNASAGLAKLNEEIKQLGSGASQQHVEKFKRETSELTTKIKGMSGEVGEAFKGLGMLRGGLAAGAAGLALFGFEIMRQSKALIEYADKIRALNQQARQIGVNPAQLKDTIEQLQAFGVSGETAVASIGAVSAKIADLQRQGSQLRLQLLQNAGPDRESVRNMSQYLDRLTNAKTVAQQLNIIREGGEQVYRNAIKQGASEQEAANRRNNFWQLQGYNAQLANAGKLQELTASEQKLADQRQKNAEALSNEWGQISKKYDTLIETMQQPFIPYLLTALKMVEGALDTIIGKVNEVEEKKLLQPDKAKESIQEKFGKFGLGGGGGSSSFEDRWKDRVPQELEKNTEATKQLTELLRGSGYQPTSFGGGGMGGGGVIAAAYHPDGGGFGGGGRGMGRPFGGGGYTNLEAGGGAAPYGSSVGAGTGAGAGATPAGPPTGGGGTPSTKGPMTLGKGDDPRGMEPYIRETARKYGVDPDTAVRVAKSEGLRDFLGDRGKSGGAFQLYTGGGLGNEFQKKTGLSPLDPANEKATIDYALSNVGKTGWGPYHGAARVGVGPREGIGGLPNGQTAGPGTGAGAGSYVGGSHTYERRRGEPGEFNYAATGAFGAPGQNLTQITLKNGQKVTVNANVADRYKGFTDELIDSGYPLDVSGGGGFAMRSKRGGGGPSMHAYGAALDINPAKNPMGGRTTDMPPDVEERAWRHGLSWGGRFGDPMHFEPMSPAAWESKKRLLADRQQIDGTQATSTKVEGTGKISVDVNAPKGTNVGAEGGGLFKNVEINRQTQMSEAKRGPTGGGYATEQYLQ